MVLHMSGDIAQEKFENSQGESNTDSVSSDSGISNCSKEDTPGRSTRDKSTSPFENQREQENPTRRSSFFDKFPRRASERDFSEFFDDPFFAEKTNKVFGNKSKLRNKPRLSERIFGNRKPGHSVFDNDNFVDDLRKKIQEEKKMFFDGGSDPFASAFGSGRPASPVGGSGRGNFPFEDLRNGARARFDEFANRHPMFSTMRNQPAWNLDDPFMAHHGFPRERHHSGSSGAGSGASTASTGEERVIPIQILRDDPPKPQPQPAPQPPMRGKSPSPPAHSIPNRLPDEDCPQSAPVPSGPQRCSTDPNHSLFAEEARTTRAQSAPPVSQNGNEQLSAKLSVDPNEPKPQPTQVGGNCSKNAKPEPVPNTNAAGVRSIPIFVEGRKASGGPSANGSCTSGQSPPQAKVSRPAERSPTPPPKKQTLPKDPLAQVTAVSEEVKELEKQVDEYKGKSREEREYLVLDEMLTRCLIKLDVVETEGRDDVRTARKECIRYIQSCISKLEKKAPLDSQPEEPCQEEQPMEIISQDAKETEAKAAGEPATNQKMEVDTSSKNSNNPEESCEEQQKPVKELISAFSNK